MTHEYITQEQASALRKQTKIAGEFTDIGALCNAAIQHYLDSLSAELPESVATDAIAYLDIGAGGYLDLGSNLTDEQLQKLPNGRHALGIIGTYGVDGYVAARPTTPPQPVLATPPKEQTCIITVYDKRIDVMALYCERGFSVMPPVLTLSDLYVLGEVGPGYTLFKRGDKTMTPIPPATAVIVSDGDVFDAVPPACY